MIISDFVECEGCGAQIEHIGTSEDLKLARTCDGEYKLCESCAAECSVEDDDD